MGKQTRVTAGAGTGADAVTAVTTETGEVVVADEDGVMEGEQAVKALVAVARKAGGGRWAVRNRGNSPRQEWKIANPVCPECGKKVMCARNHWPVCKYKGQFT